jgi:hypothetical protein
MGQARIRKQKGAYPTQIFELEPQESKRLAELLPPYIIGMKFDQDGLEQFQVSLDAVIFEPGFITIKDLGRMPFDMDEPLPPDFELKEVWISNRDTDPPRSDSPEPWFIILVGETETVSLVGQSLRFCGKTFAEGGFKIK